VLKITIISAASRTNNTQSANPFKKTFNWMCSSDIIFKELLLHQQPGGA